MNVLQVLFLIPIAVVGLAAGAHATAYLHGEAKKHRLRFWAFFLSTLAAMAGVVLASGAIAFILCWEAMGLASAGLVAFENREKPVRRAAWIYLLACHAGACALLLAATCRGSATMAAFVLAVVGFGLKIGFPPFHVWLPEAHPAAPAPASAVMSGAMIPLGFYGILRFFFPGLLFAGSSGAACPGACGWIILVLGAIGAVGGILFALPQANLKKLLAFSSVENMGVVAIGLGLAMLALPSAGGCAEARAACGFAVAGALAHVLNHAFLKGGLFLGAGSVLRQTGTLDQDRLGGLLRRMPFTGTLFTANALGLAGLPPLNGFLGELLIYISAFHAVRAGHLSGGMGLMAAGCLAFTALALAGGLAVAAYCKAVGATFLGEPRSGEAAGATETPRAMWLAQVALLTVSIMMVPGTALLADPLTDGASTGPLVTAAMAGFGLLILTIVLVWLRTALCPRGREMPSRPTWDCGYHAPTARMAYTGTAFTQPLADLFHPVLKSRRHLIPFRGHPSAPADAALVTATDDRALSAFWRPLFTFFARLFQRAHLLQNGSLHLYILLIILAVVVMLFAAFAS